MKLGRRRWRRWGQLKGEVGPAAVGGAGLKRPRPHTPHLRPKVGLDLRPKFGLDLRLKVRRSAARKLTDR